MVLIVRSQPSHHVCWASVKLDLRTKRRFLQIVLDLQTNLELSQRRPPDRPEGGRSCRRGPGSRAGSSRPGRCTSHVERGRRGHLHRGPDPLGGVDRGRRPGRSRRCNPRSRSRRVQRRPRRAVSATPAASSAKQFSRSAETGSGVAATIAAACSSASSRVTDPSNRPRVAANPLLVVASAWKPSDASRRAEPASHGFGMSSGSPGRCSARKRAASAAWSVIAPASGAAGRRHRRATSRPVRDRVRAAR